MPLIRKNGSKYWYIQFELNGKRYGPKSTKTEDRKIAQRMEDEWKAKAHGQQYFKEKEEITLREIFDIWLASPLAESTLRNGKATIGLFEEHFHLNVKASAFDQRELDKFVEARRKDGTADSTIANNLRVFQSAWNKPSKKSYSIPELEVPETREVKTRIEVVSEEDQEKILALIEKRSRKGGGRGGRSQDLADVFTLLFDTGARVNEIAKLEWSQVKLKLKTIELWRSKTASEDYVFMTDRVHRILQRRYESRTQDQWVFTNRDGDNHRSPDTQHMNDLMRAAGVDRTTHKIRHAMATDLLREGYTLYHVQKVLGHKDFKNTLRYSHLEAPEISAKVSNMLNERHVQKARQKIKAA